MFDVLYLAAPPLFDTGGAVDVENGVVADASAPMQWAVGIDWVHVRRYYRARGWRIRRLRRIDRAG